jgi:hypothetical protein
MKTGEVGVARYEGSLLVFTKEDWRAAGVGIRMPVYLVSTGQQTTSQSR